MKLETILATKGPVVHTIEAAEGIDEAIRRLSGNDIGVLVVVDDGGRVAGILSERDIIRALSRSRDALSGRVEDIMTTDIVAGSPGDDVDAVLETMTDRHFRHLPIIEDGRPTGLITIGDLVKAQLADTKGIVETLEAQIVDE